MYLLTCGSFKAAYKRRLGPQIGNPCRVYPSPPSAVLTCRVRKLQKRLGPQIANPQSATFAEGPQI
jgi:hypothetical protein